MTDPDEHLMTVFTAALECGTAGDRAAYLERACGGNPGLRARVEALLRAHARAGNFLEAPLAGQAATATFAPAGGPGMGPSVGQALDEELRQLLRFRLIVVHLLALGFVALMAGLSVLIPEEGASSPRSVAANPWLFLLPLAGESLAGAAALWRSPGMSRRSLRAWEAALFVSHAAYHADFRFRALVYMAGTGPDLTATAVGFSGAVSLFGFVALILAYGVLVPNPGRRSLAGVAALTAVPFAALAAAAAVNPGLRAGGHVPPLALQAALALLVPAAVAVFAAARATALQRRAVAAERVGQYLLRRKLGEGGMGQVWLAEHALLKRPCAVKFVRPDLAASPAIAARFAREVGAVTRLAHVNTVRVYDYGRADDGSFYLVMEYLDGPTLEELVRTSGPLPPGRAVHLLRQVCGALAEAHAAGLVHRDLKPGNVIVTALGGQPDVAKLLDFGLVHDLSAEADDRLTRTGTVLGTPAYMSPEQAAGEAAVDARGDVYGLGAVAFFALTGRPPFTGKVLGQVLAAHRTEPPPRLTDLRPDLPADLAAVVARCLAKDPAQRFPSAAEVGRALARCGCAADRSAERAAE
jgi:serine/threonine-protein kinase